ncbi:MULTISPECIES: bifunctional 5,10-methylenetetrahydrofolate dehydrogenase/5,10-methenyltetrahydrofolate cyclohydrolase [unclassified Streptomyces]|uniref:bifunctional 5,10-methylenetetrahydrofolate dehydrogenase/5,10-methenyltetrahydrofolate cyclohydrolase n=1 Tax=unclassified Streptomyces TaxID=2593676 RepID=UPI0019096DF1|nr:MULTISPECIES: bifunctional 5,10-methylenetetrahydrofolate dehydrogenase/5,10-methenyltetrahydrofolate cyclohydrolase [unclassified Streptomyces]MBK3564089.1 bifunctional 5,10-methylenetetrahydrofolate dehydrogenase/5,10-methenyltetrahydrofolate cyclohydrolase [Streptomyces sp. MBT62]MBK6018053.1 bifunctional 5,10-methylenetetrahydrofolate dehydrogenase/5,10-methenyltetrahydrofolate cyclohydrolase [Streptomyces sp. MBT53]
MSQARLMDGTALARRIVEDTAKQAADLTERTGTAPCLATVLVGADPASVTYVRMKQNRSRKAGIESRHVELPATTTTAELVATLTALSADPSVHGILLQHPMGEHIDERAAFEAIAPEKDVDGVTFASFAAMSFGLPGFVSCTPGGIMRLLDEYDVDPSGKRAVVVGRSAILGKPAGMLLLARDATVTYCHSRTRDLSVVVREADIVVAAVGRPRLIRGEDIKPGAVVLDAGYNAGNVGDVDFDSAAERASLITPVPGGVGPMTIATLLEQTVTAAARQLGV